MVLGWGWGWGWGLGGYWEGTKGKVLGWDYLCCIEEGFGFLVW